MGWSGLATFGACISRPPYLPGWVVSGHSTCRAARSPPSESAGPSAAQRPVQVERGADEGQVGERLGEVPQRLPAGARLLRVESQVIGVAEHLLEQEPRILQATRVGAPGAGQRLD